MLIAVPLIKTIGFAPALGVALLVSLLAGFLMRWKEPAEHPETTKIKEFGEFEYWASVGYLACLLYALVCTLIWGNINAVYFAGTIIIVLAVVELVREDRDSSSSRQG